MTLKYLSNAGSNMVCTGRPMRPSKSVDLVRSRIAPTTDKHVDSRHGAAERACDLLVSEFTSADVIAEWLATERETHLGSPPNGVIDQRFCPCVLTGGPSLARLAELLRRLGSRDQIGAFAIGAIQKL